MHSHRLENEKHESLYFFAKRTFNRESVGTCAQKGAASSMQIYAGLEFASLDGEDDSDNWTRLSDTRVSSNGGSTLRESDKLFAETGTHTVVTEFRVLRLLLKFKFKSAEEHRPN